MYILEPPSGTRYLDLVLIRVIVIILKYSINLARYVCEHNCEREKLIILLFGIRRHSALLKYKLSFLLALSSFL